MKFRKQQLKKLLDGIKQNTQKVNIILKKTQIHEAHEADLGYKNIGSTKLFALSTTIKTIEYIIDNLE